MEQLMLSIVEQLYEGVPFKDVTNTNQQTNEVNNNNHESPLCTTSSIDTGNDGESSEEGSAQVAEKETNNNSTDEDQLFKELLQNSACRRRLLEATPSNNKCFWPHWDDIISVPMEDDIIADSSNMTNICTKTTKSLSELLANHRNVEKLALLGRRNYDYAELATLHKLVRLDIHIDNGTFSNYPRALFAGHKQRLQELHISMENVDVTKEFGESLERFANVTKLTVFIGAGVENAQDLLLYFGRLAEYGKLESLILAGNTDRFSLEVNYFEIALIAHVRVCSKLICTCTDHAKLNSHEKID